MRKIDRRQLMVVAKNLAGSLAAEERPLALGIVTALGEAISEYAKVALYSKMSEISEDCWCAGWLVGTEYVLWDFIKTGGGHWGQGEVTKEQAFELDVLYHDAGGWWVWRGGDEEFMPTVEWEKHLEEMSGQTYSERQGTGERPAAEQADGDIQGGKLLVRDDMDGPQL